MGYKSSLEEIAKYIEDKAKLHDNDNCKDISIQEIKELLGNPSFPKVEDFTFTIGEMNAYMG